LLAADSCWPPMSGVGVQIGIGDVRQRNRRWDGEKGGAALSRDRTIRGAPKARLPQSN
jgi:hypothetical protein